VGDGVGGEIDPGEAAPGIERGQAGEDPALPAADVEDPDAVREASAAPAEARGLDPDRPRG
jgi:hypothetical protein